MNIYQTLYLDKKKDNYNQPDFKYILHFNLFSLVLY